MCVQEEDLHEAFSEFGEVKNIFMNLDRQTGFVKGYALIEYALKAEAQAAIDAMNGAVLLTQKLKVDYAFKKGDIKRGSRGECLTAPALHAAMFLFLHWKPSCTQQ